MTRCLTIKVVSWFRGKISNHQKLAKLKKPMWTYCGQMAFVTSSVCIYRYCCQVTNLIQYPDNNFRSQNLTWSITIPYHYYVVHHLDVSWPLKATSFWRWRCYSVRRLIKSAIIIYWCESERRRNYLQSQSVFTLTYNYPSNWWEV